MRRALTGAVLTMALLAVASPAALAHPLGNFSVNHLTKVRVSADRVDVLYILDQAEIPTFQERDEPRSQVLAAKRAEITRGLQLKVNGREAALVPAAAGELRHLKGQGGLLTTRLELSLSASVEDPRRVELSDRTFPDRVGWKAIVAQPGEGTAVRTDAPSGDPTRGLRRYPGDLLDSPLDRRSASFTVEPGDGSLVAPRAEGDRMVTTRDASGQGFAGLFDDAASGQGVLVLLLLAALGWGALHALSPGHGKAMVAAYLIGTRGTARHAVGLGVTVTITHTLGVFALGLVTLLLSQYILPEDLYPWLTLVSGLLVVCIGAGVLRSLVAVGVSGGLLPCPSALVVLLAAISLHRVAFGLLLIVAFSAGLALAVTAVGLVAVLARSAFGRVGFDGRLVRLLPAASALVILLAGVAMTARALPRVG